MLRFLLIFSVLFSIGCASYTTPGRGADLAKMSPELAAARRLDARDPIQKAFDRKPLAHFPASVAVVRVQQPGYFSPTARGWGNGQFSIVTVRDVEKDAEMDRIAKLPQLRGVAPLNKLLVSGNLDSDQPLRQAAAQLQADLLLIYKFDTVFDNNDKAIPLSVVSLGLSPNQQIRVTSTASAVLLDTRTGYVYGLAEATEQQKRITNAWQNEQAVDETRRNTESAVFARLVGELEQTWTNVVATYARGN